MKMFLTRIGINCRACVCGDFTQIDLPRGVVSGLPDSMRVLAGIEGNQSYQTYRRRYSSSTVLYRELSMPMKGIT